SAPPCRVRPRTHAPSTPAWARRGGVARSGLVIILASAASPLLPPMEGGDSRRVARLAVLVALSVAVAGTASAAHTGTSIHHDHRLAGDPRWGEEETCADGHD